MSAEERFIQQFAGLFVHYRDALILDTSGEKLRQLQSLNEDPAAECDRMIAAARLALLEIEAREHDPPGSGARLGEVAGGSRRRRL